MLGHIIELDRQVFLAVNGAHSSCMDTAMVFASGKFTWIPFYFILLFFIFYKITKTNPRCAGRDDKTGGGVFGGFYLGRRDFKSSLIILCAVLLGFALCDSLSVAVFKENVHRLRPCYDPLIGNFTRLLEKKGGYYGFVSNHAANVFGLATITLFFFRKTWYTSFILIWALLVSYSRVYVGKHFPLDVICGGLFGIFIGYIICKTVVFICRKYKIQLTLQTLPGEPVQEKLKCKQPYLPRIRKLEKNPV